MSTKLIKTALRKEMKAKLAVLSDEEITRQTKRVTDKLLSDPRFINSKRVSVYLNMQHEVGTLDIIRHLFENGKECFIPKYKVGGEQMDMVPLYSLQDLKSLPMTKWKIKQPADDDQRPNALETGGLDVIVAPGMAFSKAGARLGHGRGYYDSYLKQCMEMGFKPYCIGLALKEQLVENIPMSPTDIPMDLVLVAED